LKKEAKIRVKMFTISESGQNIDIGIGTMYPYSVFETICERSIIIKESNDFKQNALQLLEMMKPNSKKPNSTFVGDPYQIFVDETKGKGRKVTTTNERSVRGGVKKGKVVVEKRKRREFDFYNLDDCKINCEIALMQFPYASRKAQKTFQSLVIDWNSNHCIVPPKPKN
jgi:hypothetical protein